MTSDDLITIAQSYLGTVGNTPAFQDLLGPIAGNKNRDNPWPLDKPFINLKQGVSTCAVVARGFLKKLSVPLGDYVTSSGLDDAIAYARTKNAWRTGKSALCKGAVVELQGKTSIHVLTVEKIDGAKITSIDGGQVASNGLQTIKRCVRTWTPGFLGGVPIVGWIDVDEPGFLPEGKSSGGGGFAALLGAAAAFFFGVSGG